MARVALEVVDSSWWKQQLRVKIASRRITALCANYIRLMQHEEQAAQAQVVALRNRKLAVDPESSDLKDANTVQAVALTSSGRWADLDA